MFEFRECSVAAMARSVLRLRVLLLGLVLTGALYGQAGWSQATCTWNQNGPGQWDNPANWSGCALGNGAPSGTPGPADHAIVGNLAPDADVDVGAVSRSVDRLTLSAGRIFGGVDISISTRLEWTGGILDGGAGATLLVLGSGSSSELSGDLHVLAKRDLQNLGTITWLAGDISLYDDAEIDNQGVLIINPAGPIRSNVAGPPPVPLLLTSDFSPLARIHNSSVPGSRIEKIGGGSVQFLSQVIFDNGNDVLVTAGVLQIAGPGGDFGTYQVAPTGRLEFGMPAGINRDLTGTVAISGSGTVHKFEQGQLNVLGGYALTGPTEVVDGVLFFDTSADPLSLSSLLVRAPGVVTSPDNLIVTGSLTWQGGEIAGTTSGLTLTLPATSTTAVSLSDAHPAAYLRSRDLINQGSVSVTAVGTVQTRLWLDAASIDNQNGFTLDSDSTQNLVVDCTTRDCGSFYNRAGATLTFVDQSGIPGIGAELLAFDNAGLVELTQGCAAISAPGTDTGTYRYAGSCTLALFPRPDTERVFQPTVVLDPIGSTALQLGGSLRVNGSGRSFANLIIDPSATLFGPAAITFTGITEWRGSIEGTSTSETVTVAPGATLQTNSEPADTPLLFARTLFNNGDINVNQTRLLLDGSAEIRNNAILNLLGTPIAAGAIGCASPPNCGLVTNTSGGSIQSVASSSGPATRLETDIAVVNQGSLRVDNGKLDLESTFTASPGSVLDVGLGAGLRRTAGNLVLADGFLRGAGVINANVDADLVDIDPAGSAVGNLAILGNFTATANTRYLMGIAGTTPPVMPKLGDLPSAPAGVPSYDRLTISGSANLDGTLDVFDLGYAAAPVDVFDLMLYASRNGSVLPGLNPYSGAGLSLQLQPTRLQLGQPVAAACEWNPGGAGADDWTNPAKWNNCGAGVGPGPGPVGTPGADDVAVIGGGTVNLDVPVTVSGLQFTGGIIQGPANLSVVNDLIWTGGRFQGASGSLVTTTSGTLASLSGGQHTIDGRTLILNSATTWTTGLIELANGGILEIAPSATLFSNPSIAFESIFGSGLGTAEVRNAGLIVKQGVNSSGIGQSVQYSGAGNIAVNSGDFIFAATTVSTLDADYAVDPGASLHFVGGNRSFGVTATLGGSGSLIFGDSSPVPGINTVNGCINSASTVFIRNAELVLNCGGPSELAGLLMLDALAVLEGSSAISVNDSLIWAHGTIRGTGLTQTVELALGATGQFSSSRGPAVPRTLSNRRLRNFGTIVWTAANPTQINDGAQFINESGGNLDLSGPGTRGVSSNLPSASRLVNDGTLIVQGGAGGDIDVDFDNSGSVQVQEGLLRLRRAGTDAGSYTVDAPSVLAFDGAVRTLQAGSVVSGSGAAHVINSASLVSSGSFEPHDLRIDSGGLLQIDSAAPQLIQTLLLQSATLTGNAEVRIGTYFDWRNGGALDSVGASPGPVVIQSGAVLEMCAGICTLSNRVLRIEGLADWRGGVVEVPIAAAAKISIALGGTLQTSAVKSAAQFRCAAPTCTAEMEVVGTLREIGDGANFALTAPLLINGGTLTGNDASFVTSGVTVTSGTIDLAGGELVADPVILNGGALRGNGLVDGNVSNLAGRVQPGASPGRIDILGSYTQGPAGILDIEVGGLAPGVDSDFLFASAASSIDGTLNVIDAGYSLIAPSTLNFLGVDSSLSGSFAVTNIAYPGYSVSYGPQTATLIPNAAALLVNSSADPGDGICDLSECTLRDALIAANLLPDPDVIEFAIPALQCSGPGGSCVIAPTAPLPVISGPVLIDGYSQPGSFPNTQAPSLGLGSAAVLQIELDGAAVGGDGLVINAPSSSLVEIHGLALYRWSNAIHIQGPGDSNQVIGGNFVGLRADGSLATPMQGTGIAVFGGHAVIGGGPAHDMNVIGGNSAGIRIGSIAPGSGVAVQGNLIGTAPDGLAARPNQLGIVAVTATEIPGIVIGGNLPDYRNVISGNSDDGVSFTCTAISANCFDGASVQGNFIGTTVDAAPLGNGGDGVVLAQMTSGLVSIGGVSPGAGNLIAFNVANGIRATNFSGTARASFLVNEILANGAQAIELGADGRTANDSVDGDTGPNGLLNFANFTSYTAPGGNSAVIDLLLDTPDAGGNYPARVDFYKAVEDEPGIWLGSTLCAQPNINCSASFAFPGGVTVNPEDAVLAVVTDAFGKSSEASFYASATLITSTTPDPSPVGTPYTVAVEVSSPQPFAPIGAVAVDDGAGNSCNVTLIRISDGRSGGSCQLPSLAPSGGRTVTAQYVFNNPLPAQPFTSSSTTAGHTIAGLLPVVSSISPTSGSTAGGTVVTLNGTDFVIGATAVDFGSTPASAVNCSSTTQCTATSPAGAGVVDVRATTVAGTSANTAADDFTYTCPATQVTNGNDSGIGSLRQVIADACAGSIVTFSGAVGAVNLSSAELLIAKDLTLDGGLGVTIARQAATPDFRIFNIVAGSTVVLDSLTISNGSVADNGAGILSAGNLTVTDSVISGNNSTAGFSGGGIANQGGTLVVDNTTVSGNTAAINGGGIVQLDGGSATLTRCTISGNAASFGGAVMSQAQPTTASLDINNCTISGNTASNDGPGIYLLAVSAGSTAMNLRNSTIAANGGVGAAIITRVISGTATSTLQNNVYAGNVGPNVTIQGSGVNTSLGNNLSDDATGGGGPGDLINTDPLLAALGNYGGSTQTHALLPGSPAINAANNAAASATDQRGIARPQQGTADIGAFESQGFVLSVVSGTPQSTPLSAVFAQPLVVGVGANGVGEPVNGGQVLYSAPGAGATAIFTNPAVVAAGEASITATANAIFGSYSVTASSAGASGTPTFALSNGVVATATTISSVQPAATVVGEPYSVSVSVLDGSTPVTTGIVEVRQLSDGAICTFDLASASHCDLVANSAITTAVRARYQGAGAYAASQSPTVSHDVNRAATVAVIVSDSPDPSQVLQPVLVTAEISVTAPGAGTPSGEVLVTDGTASCSFELPARSCTLIPKALGAATLEARYQGDANFSASVDTEAHTISVDGADLSIVKRNGLRLIPGGQPSTYILLVSNAGPQDVVNARVSDILPSQFSAASWTCAASSGASCPASGVGTVDALVSLAAGSSATFSLTVTAQVTPEQVVSNRATVTPPTNAPDPVIENNESTDTDVIGVFGEGFESENE